MAFIFCSSGAIVTKAGSGANITAKTSGAILSQYSSEAEALICAVTRYDWIGNYGSLGANFKPLLGEIASNIAGAYLVSYDNAGYQDRIEAENIIVVLRDAALRGLSIIRDKKVEDFIN